MERIISKLFVVSFLAFFVVNCTDDTPKPKNLNLSITLTGKSECKSNKSAEINKSATNSQSCIDYSFNQTTQKLTLKHINTAFNCCPESISCSVTFKNDSIIIQESEKSPRCNCDCLYDLDMEVDGVEAGKYQIHIIESYIGSQDKLSFELDLGKQKQGTWCVTRNGYPWGI